MEGANTSRYPEISWTATLHGCFAPPKEDFWRTKTIFQTPFPVSIMSRNQFFYNIS